MKNLTTTPINGSTSDGEVEITDVHYDLITLEIEVGVFEGNNKKVIFNDICGFKALDEGDLSFWWKETNLENGWCFEVSKGGWLEFEKQRKDFISGTTGFYREFLVIGVDLCVSVISKTYPEIHET